MEDGLGDDPQDCTSGGGGAAGKTDHPCRGPDQCAAGGDAGAVEGAGGESYEGDDSRPPGEGGRRGQSYHGEAGRKKTIGHGFWTSGLC